MGAHVYLSLKKNETATMLFSSFICNPVFPQFPKQTNNLPPYLNGKVP